MNANIYQLPTPLAANVGVAPNFKFMITGDNLATVSIPGYLNQIDLQSNPISSTDILQILYNFNPQTQSGDYASFRVSITNGIIRLYATISPGNVILPVEPLNIPLFDNPQGVIFDAGYRFNTALNQLVPTLNDANPFPENNLVAFVDTVGSIGALADGAAYTANGPLILGSDASTFGTALTMYADGPHGGVLVITPNGNTAGAAAHLETDPTLAQNCEYTIPNTGVGTSTLGCFTASVTSGHLLVAGTLPGTIVDGGSPPTGFVTTAGASVMQAGSEIVFDHVFPQTISGSSVTINNQAGIIQTNDLTTAGGAEYTFTLNNNLLTAASQIQLQLQYGSNLTRNIECVLLTPPMNGSCEITLINNNSAAMNGDMKVYFYVPY